VLAGVKSLIQPGSKLEDVTLGKDKLKGVRLIPAKTLADVLQHALKDCKRKHEIINELRRYEKGGAGLSSFGDGEKPKREKKRKGKNSRKKIKR